MTLSSLIQHLHRENGRRSLRFPTKDHEGRPSSPRNELGGCLNVEHRAATVHLESLRRSAFQQRVVASGSRRNDDAELDLCIHDRLGQSAQPRNERCESVNQPVNILTASATVRRTVNMVALPVASANTQEVRRSLVTPRK
jgi:hypothetical protein